VLVSVLIDEYLVQKEQQETDQAEAESPKT
jgi:hypothetical protein